MSYKKPTLIEILVEFHFNDGTLPESKFFDIVPLLKDAGLSDIEMKQTASLSQSKNEPIFSPRVRCWDVGHRRLVQLSPDLMIINQTKEYLGWTSFVELVQQAMVQLSNAGIEHNIKSISLTTIDSFQTQKDGFRLGDWLDCDGPMIPSWYSETSQASDITLGLGIIHIDRINRQLNVQVRPGAGDVVTIKINSVFHNMLSDTNDPFDLLNTLHDEATESFESIITQRLRDEVMEGILH